jgi:hypothetical protein
MRGAIMKARGKNTVYALTLLMIVYLLLPTCMAYAAPAATQKSTQQAQPATGAATGLLNPNAPPKGTITIPASSKGNVNASTWITGSYQFIEWTCNGTRSNLVDVTLWQNNQQVVVIGTGIASGKTAYAVPSNIAIGSYELRVTSEDDTRVEARQAINISLPTITVTAPKDNEILYPGSQYTITWTYVGDPGPVKLELKLNPKFPGSLSPITMAGGQGSAVWTIPPIPGTFLTTQDFFITVRSTTNLAISARSGIFRVVLDCKNLTNCSGACVDLQTDSDNCGSCRNICKDHSTKYGKSVCVQGQCLCAPGSAQCTNMCTDLQIDFNNCGRCGNSCDNLGDYLDVYAGKWISTGVCINGQCQCRSDLGGKHLALCGGPKCLFLDSDSMNCGKCGNTCLNGGGCKDGSCGCNDPAGRNACQSGKICRQDGACY